MDEGRKRVLLIAASILAARKLAQYDSGARVPATVAAIGDAIRWAERIMEEIDRRWAASQPTKTPERIVCISVRLSQKNRQPRVRLRTLLRRQRY